MIYNEIIELLNKNDPNGLEDDKQELANLILYKIVNNPYLKNKYKFVNLYKTPDEKYKIGKDITRYSDTQIYHPDEYSLESSTLSYIEKQQEMQTVNILLSEDDKDTLKEIVRQIKGFKSLIDFGNLTINEYELLDKVSLSDIQFKNRQKSKTKKFLKAVIKSCEVSSTDDDKFILKNTFDNDNIISEMGYPHYLEKIMFNLLNEETSSMKISELLKYEEQMISLLNLDNLSHLIPNHQSYKKLDNSFLDKFKDDSFKNTVIGILMSDKLTSSMKIIKIYDKLHFEGLKKSIAKKASIILDNETIEDVIEKKLEQIIPIENILKEKYKELKSDYINEYEIKFTLYKDLQKLEDKSEIENLINNMKKDMYSELKIIADLNSELQFNGFPISSYSIERGIKDTIRQELNNDIIIIKNNLELLGVVNTDTKVFSEGINHVDIEISSLKENYFTPEQIKDIFKNIIDIYKKDDLIINISFYYLNTDNRKTFPLIMNAIKNIKKEYEDTCIINIFEADLIQNDKSYFISSYTQTSKGIPYKDILKTIKTIDKLYDEQNTAKDFLDEDLFRKITKEEFTDLYVRHKNKKINRILPN